MHGCLGFGKAIKIAKKIHPNWSIGWQSNTHPWCSWWFPVGNLPQSKINSLKPTFNDPLNYRVIAELGIHIYILTMLLFNDKKFKNENENLAIIWTNHSAIASTMFLRTVLYLMILSISEYFIQKFKTER